MLSKAAAPVGKPSTLRLLALALLLSWPLLPLSSGVLVQPGAIAANPLYPARNKLPLYFEPNVGQTDSSVRYLAHTPGGVLFFTPGEVVLALDGHHTEADEKSGANPQAPRQIIGTEPDDGRARPSASVQYVARMKFVAPQPDTTLLGTNLLPGKINYFRGSKPSQWQTNVPTYAVVTYQGLYPGIDLVYSGTDGNLKGTYEVRPGVDPSIIRWHYDGATDVVISDAGDLQISIPSKLDGQGPAIQLTEESPVAWQEINGQQRKVSVAYQLGSDGTIGFRLNGYDPSHALIIDPTITYSTYLGGGNYDGARSIQVLNGNAYITGFTYSTNFPTRDPYQPLFGGSKDAFVTKLSADGSQLVYSTYLGGSGWDQAEGLALDSAGNAYITGQTFSTDFPTFNAYQPAPGGAPFDDAFVTKLNSSGAALVYSTYLGGANSDSAYKIAVDGSGSASVTGSTVSDNFPTSNPFQPARAGSSDAFVTRFAPSGQSLLFSTYLGGTQADYGNAITVDTGGYAYAVGYTFSFDFPVHNAFQPAKAGSSDAFVTRFEPAGTTLSYSTYLGGPGDDTQGNDVAWSISVDNARNAYIAGWTLSQGFPTRNPFQPAHGGGFGDAFLTKLNSTGNDLVYSTYLGGSGTDEGYGVAVDGSGSAFVSGLSASPNFPVRNPVWPNGRAFIAQFNHDGSDLLFSSRIGGTRNDYGYGVAVDSTGALYLCGSTESLDFPTVNPYQAANAGGFDGFITKISGVNAATPTVSPPTTTRTPTSTSTSTSTSIATNAPTSTSTSIPTSTPTSLPTHTSTSTPPTPTVSSTSTVVEPSRSPTVTSTSTPTNTPPPQATPTARQLTITPAPTETQIPTNTSLPQTTSTSTSTPATCTLEFADVPQGHTFYASIRCLACRGIISGYSDGTFKPDNLVTRSQLAKIVSNAAGFREDPGPQIYEDVPASSPFYEWINRLSRRGYMGGYTCGGAGELCVPPGNRAYFRPFADATRAQTSKIVSNAARYTDSPTGQSFEDVPTSHPFYVEIQRLVSRGIMGGYECGGVGEPCVPPGNRAYFRPYNNVTRGQSAKIVANTFYPYCPTP